MKDAACKMCSDFGIRPDGRLADYCTCPAGSMERKRSNLRVFTAPAIAAYRTAGLEPITSASNAQWDEMESALDRVRLHALHICRSCDHTLPIDAKCGERCERCEEELAALGKSAPMFDRLDRWVLGLLGGVAVACVLLLIKTMVWG